MAVLNEEIVEHWLKSVIFLKREAKLSLWRPSKPQKLAQLAQRRKVTMFLFRHRAQPIKSQAVYNAGNEKWDKSA